MSPHTRLTPHPHAPSPPGLLPGQRGKQIHFAHAPKHLDFELYRSPCDADDPKAFFYRKRLRTSDIYFLEVAFLAAA